MTSTQLAVGPELTKGAIELISEPAVALSELEQDGEDGREPSDLRVKKGGEMDASDRALLEGECGIKTLGEELGNRVHIRGK